MKTLKYLSFLVLTLIIGISVSSCGKEEDLPLMDEINNFFIDYQTSGGGLNAAQLEKAKISFMAEYGTYIEGVATNEAIYAFKQLVKEIREDFPNGIMVDDTNIIGTMDLTMTLNTEEGKKVMTGIVHFKKDSSSHEFK